MMACINFPLFNISYPNWELELLGDFFLYNDVYNYKEDFFNEYYLDQLFIDCDGCLFKVVGKTPLKPRFWNSKSFKIEFLKQEGIMSLESFKKILLEKSLQIKEGVARNVMQEIIEKEDSIEGLLIGVP